MTRHTPHRVLRAVLRALPVAWLMAALVSSAVTGQAQGTGAVARGEMRSVTFWSQALGVRKDARVWLPPSYASGAGRRYPVAYYLHGLGGNEGNWTARGALHSTLDSATSRGLPEMIVVMPDGDDGWYTTWSSLGDYAACRRDFRARDGDTADSYCVPCLHYDDYIARDLVSFVDSTFRTLPGRAHRALAGLSMGGYGAITIALRYPDVFAAAASHSGVLSPLLEGRAPDGTVRPMPEMKEIEAAWGSRFFPLLAPAFGPDTAAWWSRDPARLAGRARTLGSLPALMFDVGVDDPFLPQNRAFRDALRALGIPHRYAEWPGKHDWEYWRTHAPESLAWIAGSVARP